MNNDVYGNSECRKTFGDKMNELEANNIRNIFYCEKEPEKIYAQLFNNESTDKKDFERLCKTFKHLAFNGMGILAVPFSSIMYLVYRIFGEFIRESDWFSEKSERIINKGQMALIQRAYTWAHIGCTTLCIWDEENKQNVCMRSLDWQGAPALGKTTRIYHHKRAMDQQGSDFSTVGVVGMAGALTGIKKGFSIAINYAPWHKTSIDSEMDPTFKLRKLLENNSINTYEKAVTEVESWKVSSPVFLILCGVEKEQACVVEIGKNDRKNTRKIDAEKGLLVQTNYFDEDENSEFKDINSKLVTKQQQNTQNPVDKDGNVIKTGHDDNDWYCGKLIPTSKKRREDLEAKFKNIPVKSADLEKALFDAYEKAPVWNWETTYWTLMRPASGTMRVFARNESAWTEEDEERAINKKK